jgi:putative transcriptional regulator
MVSPLQGHLLIASPEKPDPGFFETVILLVQHSEEQAVGLVLNRPSATTIKEVFAGAYDGNGHVHSGGPAPGPLMAIHTCKPYGEIEVIAGVYYSVKKKNLEKIIREPDSLQRLFDGHAGWGPGQIEEQIKFGEWQVMPATVEHVFYEEHDLWEKLAPSF